MTEKTLVELSEEHYSENSFDFYSEVDWHLQRGWVISTPAFFGMGYFVDEGENGGVHVS